MSNATCSGSSGCTAGKLALAVSAINGCGSCVASHERQLPVLPQLPLEPVQSAVRIAATVHAVARVLESVGGERLAKAAA